jgi:hypothetical protein
VRVSSECGGSCDPGGGAGAVYQEIDSALRENSR